MAQIQTMYHDGVLGLHSTISSLGMLLTGIFNYIRPKNSAAYSLEKTLGLSHDYIYPPLSDAAKKESVNEKLKLFMSQAPGFVYQNFGGK